MWSTRAVDVLVWVAAGNRTAIVAGYARAAADLHLADGPGAAGTSGATGVGAGETADDGAQRFLDWLRRTQRRWAVVLDGVASPVDLDGLWPEGPAGQVVVTSRLRAQELSDPGARRTAYAVPGFSRREAVGYLNTRLVSFPDQRIEALDLAEDIEGMPLAIAQAASVIAEAEGTCREYRAEYAQRRRSNPQTAIDGCPQSLVATWSLAVEYAHELPPAGLAWPALAFAAMLDTNGIPAAVLTSPAACVYITGRPEVGSAEQTLVRSAYATLERLGLASVDNNSTIRTVWLHSSVRACVRAYLTPASIDQVVQAAATALAEAWPPVAESVDLSQALRDCTAALHAFAGDLLWKPEAHPALRPGRAVADGGARAGGRRHPLLAGDVRRGRASARTRARAVGARPEPAGRRLRRRRAARRGARGGRGGAGRPRADPGSRASGHGDGPGQRGPIARGGRPHDPRRSRSTSRPWGRASGCSGAAHPETLVVRAQLAAAYSAAGRRGDSIRLYEQTRSDAERALGPLHPDTLAAGASLAAAYLAAGQGREAIAAVPAGAGRPRADAAGPTTRRRWRCGPASRTPSAAAGSSRTRSASYERVLADRSRVLGEDHPDTISARASLAYAYRTAGRLKDAIPHYERVVADRERVQGQDHRDTIASRAVPRRRLPAGTADAGRRRSLRARGRRRRPDARARATSTR